MSDLLKDLLASGEVVITISREGDTLLFQSLGKVKEPITYTSTEVEKTSIHLESTVAFGAVRVASGMDGFDLMRWLGALARDTAYVRSRLEDLGAKLLKVHPDNPPKIAKIQFFPNKVMVDLEELRSVLEHHGIKGTRAMWCNWPSCTWNNEDPEHTGTCPLKEDS